MSTSVGWIGVDLDGTLAEYHGWDEGKIGPPVPLMLERVKNWLQLGIEVRIFTARIWPYAGVLYPDSPMAVPEGERGAQAFEMACRIGDWCMEHLGERLPITCMKDYSMVQLWDDRAVAVEPNTGLVAFPKPPR